MNKSIIVFFAILPILTSLPASAGPVEEVRLGVSLQSSGPLAVEVEDGAAFGGEVIFKSPDLFSFIGKAKPHFGVSVATDGDATSFAYAGLTWRANFFSEKGIFVDFGLGGAVHNGRISFDPFVDGARPDGSFLGCPVLFRLHGGPGIKINERWTALIQFEHLSNAGFCDENEGLDNLGLRFGYTF